MENAEEEMEYNFETRSFLLSEEEMFSLLDLVDSLINELNLNDHDPVANTKDEVSADEVESKRVKTFCCRYWAGDGDSPSNAFRRKITVRTQTLLQASIICSARRYRDFKNDRGGATVTPGECAQDDWTPS